MYRSLVAIALVGAGLLATPRDVLAQSIVVFRGVGVAIPRTPDGNTWDDVLSRPAGLTSIYPDIQICLESQHVPATCLPVCPNADWVENETITGYVCRHHQTEIIAEVNLAVSVHDVDGDRTQMVWQDILPNPGACVGKACTFDIPGGPLKVEFVIDRMDFANYTGPFRGTLGSPAPTRAPAPEHVPTPPAVIPTPNPRPAAPQPSYWDQITDAWERFTSYFSPADAVDAFCSTPRSNVLSWACGYFFGNTVRTFENAATSRIACLRGELGTGAERQTAENACRQYQNGSSELEKCLLKYFEVVPPKCMFSSDMQGQ